MVGTCLDQRMYITWLVLDERKSAPEFGPGRGGYRDRPVRCLMEPGFGPFDGWPSGDGFLVLV